MQGKLKHVICTTTRTLLSVHLTRQHFLCACLMLSDGAPASTSCYAKYPPIFPSDGCCKKTCFFRAQSTPSRSNSVPPPALEAKAVDARKITRHLQHVHACMPKTKPRYNQATNGLTGHTSLRRAKLAKS